MTSVKPNVECSTSLSVKFARTPCLGTTKARKLPPHLQYCTGMCMYECVDRDFLRFYSDQAGTTAKCADAYLISEQSCMSHGNQ